MKQLIALVFTGLLWPLTEAVFSLSPPAPSAVTVEESQVQQCAFSTTHNGYIMEMADSDLNLLEADLKRMEQAIHKK